jgi:glycosyltransferase involved in cell wall biosynthesis
MSFKIHWLCPSPSPYNDYFFRSVTVDPEIDLLVHFWKQAISSHPWSVPMAQGFPCRYYKEVFGVDWKLIKLAMNKAKSLFIVAGWNHPTVWLLLTILITRKRPFIVWTDTPDLKKRRIWAKDKLRSAWLKLVFHNAIAVMGTGKLGVQALEKMGCSKEKLVNFPFFLDLKRYRNNSDAFEKIKFQFHSKYGDSNTILFFGVGQYIPRKGYDLAINALAKAIQITHNSNVRLLLAGDGPEKEHYTSLANELGISKQIALCGWLQPDEIETLNIGCDVLLHPARQDPFPTVVLDAMTWGKPVIGSDASGSVLDRIEHGVNGLIHKAGDVDQIAEQMSFFIRTPTEIIKMGQEARRTAEQWPVERGVEIIKQIAKKVFSE